MSGRALGALSRAPNAGPPMYTASAPWLMASMPMSASRAGASSSSAWVAISLCEPCGRTVERGLQLVERSRHRELRELLRHRLGRMDQEARIGGAEHRGVVVRIAGSDHAEVQVLKRLDRATLLVGLAQL